MSIEKNSENNVKLLRVKMFIYSYFKKYIKQKKKNEFFL